MRERRQGVSTSVQGRSRRAREQMAREAQLGRPREIREMHKCVRDGKGCRRPQCGVGEGARAMAREAAGDMRDAQNSVGRGVEGSRVGTRAGLATLRAELPVGEGGRSLRYVHVGMLG